MTLVKNPSTGKVLELFGPTLEFLTSPQDLQNDFCVMRGTLPPGVSVPLHSHAAENMSSQITTKMSGITLNKYSAR